LREIRRGKQRIAMWNNPSWDEKLIRHHHIPEPELPEDILFDLLRRKPMLAKLIDKFDLEIEQ